MRWLVGYSALLGPLGGVLLADFHLVRQRRLVVQDLYSLQPGASYWYRVRALLCERTCAGARPGLRGTHCHSCGWPAAIPALPPDVLSAQSRCSTCAQTA